VIDCIPTEAATKNRKGGYILGLTVHLLPSDAKGYKYNEQKQYSEKIHYQYGSTLRRIKTYPILPNLT